MGLKKAFGSTEVLRSADLSINFAEATVITGPSGSGKSTLMAILGLLSPRDGGELRMLGTDISLRPASSTVMSLRRRMAWLPQLPMVLPGRTCLDNSLVGMRARRALTPTDIDFARELFTRLGVEHLGHRDVSVLSGGELQKVALIRALVARPVLVLADEPTASLDRESTRAVITALRAASEFSTLVVASHDPAVADACDRAIAMKDGLLEVVPS